MEGVEHTESRSVSESGGIVGLEGSFLPAVEANVKCDGWVGATAKV